MANSSEDYINSLSREDFFDYAIKGIKGRSKCADIACSECPLDYTFFHSALNLEDLKGHNGCRDVTGYIADRLAKELTADPSQKEPEIANKEPETGNCSSCIYYRDYSGTGFCEIWHNFTQPYVYCSYHSAKEAEA